MAAITKVSPLAPAGGFPDLPAIAGVQFSAIAAGVKYADRTDVMLASCAPGTCVAGVFTRSATRSANVLDCQRKLGQSNSGEGYAFIVNSGNSNAFTGRAGDASVERICDAVSAAVDIPVSHVFTASTGVIGERLPDERITAVIDDLAGSLDPGKVRDAAEAIMTTDTFAKGAAAEIEVNGRPVRIAGFAKGSGMIAPDMATMLVFIFTDAQISQNELQMMVSEHNSVTFNAITVDSDTSTSDSLLVAATGASGVDVGGQASFAAALHNVMRDLAHLVVRDGEGATKFVEIRVEEAQNAADARKVAMSIANSPLVKTAIAGEDPNWGRIVMAVGKSGAKADRDRLSILFGDILVAEHGWVADTYQEEDAAIYMRNETLVITVRLGIGAASDTVWTCDLTHDYISINADYRS
ncbi:MAG: bifunctional glutamate N-acetyltransferase/amino-acid acetyltransferase ArgJ [Pseudomonadota bacterium]